jgi:Mn-containing catalase
MPTSAEGVPFDCSHVYASGNIAADMHSNVKAGSTGRLLVTQLYHLTDDPGMKDMLSFLIVRDTMHQQQWLAVIEELGGHEGVLPIPNGFPQDRENEDVNYLYVDTRVGVDAPPPEGRFTSGPPLDGKSDFRLGAAPPLGEKPELGPADPSTFPSVQQQS